MSSTAVISFLQLWLATLAFAAPAVKTEGLEPWHYGTGGGIVGFVVLVMDIIVWIEVLQSSRPPSHKLLWCLVVFLFPVIGVIIYFFFSDRKSHVRGSGYQAIA